MPTGDGTAFPPILLNLNTGNNYWSGAKCAKTIVNYQTTGYVTAYSNNRMK